MRKLILLATLPALLSINSFADTDTYSNDPIVIKAQQRYNHLVQQTEEKAQQKRLQQQQQLLQMQQQLKGVTPTTNTAAQQAITPSPGWSPPKPSPLATPTPSPYAAPTANPWAPPKTTNNKPAPAGADNIYLPPTNNNTTNP